MDPNINFDTLWDQIKDKELEDNTNEEVIRLILQSQQVNIITRCKQRRKVVNRNREERHDRLFNDYFSPNLVLIETQF